MTSERKVIALVGCSVGKTTSLNLAALQEQDRLRIELEKQAHLLLWRRRRNDISRQDVIAAIEAVDEQHREWFRQLLNQIRSAAK